jgi:hypothetical protein
MNLRHRALDEPKGAHCHGRYHLRALGFAGAGVHPPVY